MTPKIGTKISFVPAAFQVDNGGDFFRRFGIPSRVTATIEYINYEHRYFRAKFEVFGTVMHECFKF